MSENVDATETQTWVPQNETAQQYNPEGFFMVTFVGTIVIMLSVGMILGGETLYVVIGWIAGSLMTLIGGTYTFFQSRSYRLWMKEWNAEFGENRN